MEMTPSTYSTCCGSESRGPVFFRNQSSLSELTTKAEFINTPALMRILNDMKSVLFLVFLGCANPCFAANNVESKPDSGPLANFHPAKAPAPTGLLLQKGDRLAICGDSITEQKEYSRIMETYLTVCVPELAVAVRQYGSGGETASGFLARMTNDCLRFKPTIATTCYGMNDHGYKAYEEAIGAKYREKQTAIVE